MAKLMGDKKIEDYEVFDEFPIDHSMYGFGSAKIFDFYFYRGKAFDSFIKGNKLWEGGQLINDFRKLKLKDESFVFLDFGAHIGYYSLMCAWMCPKATIYAFEPHETNVVLLSRNLNRFENCIIYPYAMSNKEEEGVFYFSGLDPACGSSDKKWGQKNLKYKKAIITKKTSDLDIDFAKVKVIKLDTEGNDVKILEDIRLLIPADIQIVSEMQI